MKASKKFLIMEIEFQDYADLQIAMRKVWESMKAGKDWNRFKNGSTLCQYRMERSFNEGDPENSMAYREEIINGKLCMVIQSKMNDSQVRKKKEND